MTTSDDSEQLTKAQDAERLLNTSAFKEALDGAKEFYLAKLMECGPTEHEKRAIYVEALRNLPLIRGHLEALVAHGRQVINQLQEFSPKPEETRFAKFLRRVG